MDFTQLVLQARPNIKPNSAKAYATSLKLSSSTIVAVEGGRCGQLGLHLAAFYCGSMQVLCSLPP